MDAKFATCGTIRTNFKVETISCADDMASPSLKIPRARGAWPLLGHALSFRRDPIRFFRKQSGDMGPVYYFQLFQRKIVVANDPEAVEAILIGEVQQFSRKKTYAFLEALLGNGLITSEGAHWRKNRRMMQPGFKREQLVGLMGGIQETVFELVPAHRARWTKCTMRRSAPCDERTDLGGSHRINHRDRLEW